MNRALTSIQIINQSIADMNLTYQSTSLSEEDCPTKRLQSSPLPCQMCFKQLGNLIHMLTKGMLVCVGCLAKSARESQPYLIINLPSNSGGSSIPLEKELMILQAIEKNGIDSLELLGEQLCGSVTGKQIRNYIDRLCPIEEKNPISQSQRNISNKEKSNPQRIKEEEYIKAVKKDITLELFQEQDYAFSDYFLGCLHQKSSYENVEFLVNWQQRETQLCGQIRGRIAGYHQTISQTSSIQKLRPTKSQRSIKESLKIRELEQQLLQDFDVLKFQSRDKRDGVSMQNFKEDNFSIDISSSTHVFRKNVKYQKKKLIRKTLDSNYH